MSDRIRIFSSGPQWVDWQNCNCCRCYKSINTEDEVWDTADWKCDLEEALCYASISDGTVSAEQAKRLGFDCGRYVWPCSEVDWTDEWKTICYEREHQKRMFV